MVILVIIIAVSLSLAGLRMKRTGHLEQFSRWFGISLLCLWVVYNIYLFLPANFSLSTSLPLHACDVFAIIASFALIKPGRKASALLYFCALVLAAQAVITPTQHDPATYRFWLFWLLHAGIISAAILNLVVRKYRPVFKDFLFAVVCDLLYVAIVLPLNIAFGWNYGFIGDSTPGVTTIIDVLGPWPWRVVWMVGVVVVVQGGMWLGWGVKKSPNKPHLPLLALLLLATTLLHAQTHELPRSTPEAEGVPSRAITALFDSLTALPRTDIHSVMVVRHGKVIGEIYPAPFAPEYRHTIYSCSKTFVGAAVGLAIADNRLRLTDRVGAFFPELLPDSVSDNLADMTVRDLLVMGSGITPDWGMRNVRTDWIRAFLAKPVKAPGKKFEYDSICSYMLSAIVQKVTGMTLLDYLRLKLFTPMNITEVAWELSPEGINTGGWGLHIQSESLAKFGLLLLNGGAWEGRQLLPASWVKQMTGKQAEVDGVEDYGYQMWLCEYPGAIRMDGALGQFVLIIPDKDMVVVITECTLMNGRRQRRLVWNRLLPEAGDKVLIPGKDYKLLQKKQNRYQLPMPQGKGSSTVERNYAGKDIVLESNKYGWQSLRLQFKPKEVAMAVTGKDGATYELLFGHKQWLATAIDAYPPYSISSIDSFKGIEGPFRVAGSYGWLSPDTLLLKAHYVNWVSALDIQLRFEGESVFLKVRANYSAEEVTIRGRTE